LPDKRTHRGPHPEDGRLFASGAWSKLARAVHDLSWLLTNGYADKSALKLVGDRFALTQRQRMAVMRCACGDSDLSVRAERQVAGADLRGRRLLLDGYNVITTIETALAGGVLLRGRDGCYRDIASVHGTYRKVEETVPAIKSIGQLISRLGVSQCQWYLDRPVSNSGRLKALILEIAGEQGWNWEVELVYSPDGVLTRAEDIVATSDSEILNRCKRWFNLATEVVIAHVPDAQIIDLAPVREE